MVKELTWTRRLRWGHGQGTDLDTEVEVKSLSRNWPGHGGRGEVMVKGLTWTRRSRWGHGQGTDLDTDVDVRSWSRNWPHCMTIIVNCCVSCFSSRWITYQEDRMCKYFYTCILLLSDSYPAFFLPIATTSNKIFWKCRNCKWEIQMFVNSGTRGNKTGLLCSLSAFPSFIKPGTRQTGLTGRFQKSFDTNSWHLLRKGEKL